jgi:hypothetical protein
MSEGCVKSRRLLPVVGLLSAWFLTACQANGMGMVNTSCTPGSSIANLGFVYDGTTFTWSGSYQDHCFPVAFNGTGVMHTQSPPPNAPARMQECLIGEPTYQPQDSSLPGGYFNLIVCDSGNPQNTPGDYIAIQVTTGPYAGYTNSGFVRSGNIVVHN